MASVGELLDRFVSNFDEGKFDEGLEDFAEGGVLEEVGTGRTVTVAESVQNSRAWKAAFPDARGVIENKIVEGNKGAAEIVWTGTNTGSFNGMPATNKPATIRAVATMETDGGKITRVRHYLDVAGLMAQLGATPGAGGQAR